MKIYLVNEFQKSIDFYSYIYFEDGDARIIIKMQFVPMFRQPKEL